MEKIVAMMVCAGLAFAGMAAEPRIWSFDYAGMPAAFSLCGAPRTQSEREWCAWQLHRADRDAGFAIVFRRIAVDDRRFTCRLGGIDPTASYEVEFFHGGKRTMNGGELAALTVGIKTPRKIPIGRSNAANAGPSI